MKYHGFGSGGSGFARMACDSGVGLYILTCSLSGGKLISVCLREFLSADWMCFGVLNTDQCVAIAASAFVSWLLTQVDRRPGVRMSGPSLGLHLHSENRTVARIVWWS